MFNKRVTELKEDDINTLVSHAFQEDDRLEFKRELPGQDSALKWQVESRILDKARNELLEEIIAFANGHGGTLVVGIEESKEKPSRALNVSPLPRIHDLADRLKMQCRDGIEPKIPLLDIGGVSIGSEAEGVLVVNVPRSRAAPHRHIFTRECYVRRADRSEKMTMQEIQDLTLFTERGNQRIETLFVENRSMILDTLQHIWPDGSAFCAIRITLVPLDQLYIIPVHQNPSVQLSIVGSSVVVDLGKFPLNLLWHQERWRPILRGTRCETGYDDHKLIQDVYDSGIINYIWSHKETEDPLSLPLIYPLTLMVNALCSVESIRGCAGSPSCEYGMEIEIYSSQDLRIGDFDQSDHRNMRRNIGTLKKRSVIFPRYSIQGPDRFNDVATLLNRDMRNLIHIESGSKFEIDFLTAFQRAGVHAESNVKAPEGPQKP